jgi:catechol 2,3-dioxygenase-like lactoylglutathione lyase family enzyme
MLAALEHMNLRGQLARHFAPVLDNNEDVMLNTETVVHPKLQHIGLLTGNLQRLVDWYKQVLGMRPIFVGDNPTDAPAGSPPSLLKAAFISNDEISHRLALIEVPGLTADPERSRHRRVQHFAFEFLSLDDLLGSYARLKTLGIIPAMSVDEGPQTSFYYDDPDGNSVEINACNYPDRWAALEHMQTSPEFARRPLGVFVDPDQMIAARDAGATPWELHKRAWLGEFLPATRFDPTTLL